MAQGINDRNVAERDTSVGSIGALATTRMSPDQNMQAPTSIGDLTGPSTFGTEAPASSQDELDQRVARNTAFLQNPDTKAQLLQFGLSLMSSAGRGNIGGNIADALVSARQLPARAAMMNLKYNKDLSEMQNADTNTAINVERLKMDKSKFAQETIKNGGEQFSYVIGPDDVLNTKFHLNLQPGDKPARVNVLVDGTGKVIHIENTGPYDSSSNDAQKIPNLLAEADKQEKAGNAPAAALLRQQAASVGIGAGGKGDQTLVPDPTSPTKTRLENIPGGASDEAQKVTDAANAERAAGAALSHTVTLGAIHKTQEMLQNSIAPNIFLAGGIGNAIKYLPVVGQDSIDFGNYLSTIKSNLTIEKLSEMRKAAKGGASGLGQITEFEDKMLASSYGSLEQPQSAATLMSNLSLLEKTFNAVVHDGTLAEIGKKVDAGIMTDQQGRDEAAKVLATVGAETRTPEQKDQAAIPIPDKFPGLTEQEIQQLQFAWPNMSNADRREHLPPSQQ